MPGPMIWLILLFAQASGNGYQQAVTLFQAGRVEEALRTLEQLPEAESRRAATQNLRSLALMKLQRFDLALAANAAARRLDPENPNYLYNTGLIYLASGNLGRAENLFREGAAQFPGSVRILEGWAETLQRAGNLKEAEGALRKAVAVDQKSAGPQAALAKLYYSLGDRKQFAVAAQQAIALDSKNYLACFLYGKYLLEDAGREAEGRDWIARSIQLYPAFDDGLIEWAAILSREKRWQEAAQVYEQAAKANPARAQTYYLMHVAYRKCGKPEQAEAALRRYQSLRTAGAARL